MNSACIDTIFSLLSQNYPNPKMELDYETPYQLLVAVVLSAQSTDKSVNKVTPRLFDGVKSPVELLERHTLEDLEVILAPLGLYKTKAFSVYTLSHQLISHEGGIVPDSFDRLTALQGVGRKTAHVVLNELFGHPFIAVDTHVYRLSHRLGLSTHNSRDKVGDQLMEIVPEKFMKKAHHYLISHGRAICQAKKPQCHLCFLYQYCVFGQAHLRRD